MEYYSGVAPSCIIINFGQRGAGRGWVFIIINCKGAPRMYPSAKAGPGEQEDGGRIVDLLYKPAAPNARQRKARQAGWYLKKWLHKW